MQLAVFMDTDGHFEVFPIFRRDKIWNLLDSLEMLQWEYDVVLTKENYQTVSTKEWIEFVEQYTQRGQFEIVELNLQQDFGMGAILDTPAPKLKPPKFDIEERDRLFREYEALKANEYSSKQEITDKENEINKLLDG